MKITFEQFVNILEQADAVVVNGDGVCYPSVWRRGDEEDYHVSVFFKYINDEYLDFRYDVDSDQNPTVELDDESFTVLADETFTDIKVTPLFRRNFRYEPIL